MLNEKTDVYSFGVVLMEIITARPALAKRGENNNLLTQWVSSKLANGDIKSILDPRLEGFNININSVWKATEISMACVSKTSTNRPTMSQVATELKECLTAQLTRRDGYHEAESKDLIEMMISEHKSSEQLMNPLAR